MKYIGMEQLARRQKLFRVAVGTAVVGWGASILAAAFEFGFDVVPAGAAAAVAGATLMLAGLIYLYAMIRYTH